MSYRKVLAALNDVARPHRVAALHSFYKTGPGEYAEGDVFLGLPVPKTREIAAVFKDLTLSEVETLMKSPFHEARLCGLIIVTNRFKKSKSSAERKEIFDFYMEQLGLGHVNNWDLVDVSAPAIGEYLTNRKDALTTLKKLARSKSLWERRASIILTFAHIRQGEFDLTVTIAEMLLKDDHDLIHKATGWMLREAGKRDPYLLRGFLTQHSQKMPRTMLRYAIEKLPERERKSWLLNSRG